MINEVFFKKKMFTDNAFEDTLEDDSDEFEDPGCDWSCYGSCSDNDCREECCNK